MLTLLNPAALLALTGLLVPLAIHLWNRRPGREVAVGSLRWLAAGANRRLRHLKLEQRWLLLLRAALLAVLAGAVAGSGWRTAQPASRGVVLLSAEAARLPALASLKPTIDSLRRRGYALRWLAPGFPKVPGGAWRALAAGRRSAAADSAAKSQPAGLAWARVQQAAATFPSQPIFVVASAGLRNFQGRHAPLPASVTWQILPDTATASWLAAADIVGDSLQLLVGRSSETRTVFRRKRLLEQAHPGQRIRVMGLPTLRFQPDAADDGEHFNIVPADTASEADSGVSVSLVPMVIEIYATPAYAADARYLEAALRAATTGLAIPPILRRVTARPERLVTTGWTFWLSDEPLPAGWRENMQRHGGHLWQEATGPGVADTTRLATFAAAVTVFRREAQRGHSAAALSLWADALGRPVLAFQPVGRGAIYHLSTRLNPAWSELADNPDLPAQLLPLLQPELGNCFSPATPPADQPLLAQQLAIHDQRALDPSQLITASAPQRQRSAPRPAFRVTDLRPWLVLAAGLLFLIERLLARRQSGTTLTDLG